MLTVPSSASTVSTGSKWSAEALSASISNATLPLGIDAVMSGVQRGGAEFAARLVQYVELAVRDGEEGADQLQFAVAFLGPHAGEAAQIVEADLHPCLLHRP